MIPPSVSPAKKKVPSASGMGADIQFRHVTKVRLILVAISAFTIITALLKLPSAFLAVAIVVVVCFLSLMFALWLAGELLACDDGDDNMKKISEPIREGAEGFLNTQYGAIGRMSIIVGFVLLLVYKLQDTKHVEDKVGITNWTLTIMTLCSFALGATFSGVAGYVGLWMSVRANLRVAAAASRKDYANSFQVALRGGLVCGILDVGMCILGLTLLFTVFHAIIGSEASYSIKVPHLLIGYGFGASFVALFAQLGGGIYTKAADVGADMVGKVEANIPEDDPRNPAVIADLVGDNVGDCAGRGADLFESISGEIIGTMILGATLAQASGIESPSNFMFYPLIANVFYAVVSSFAAMIIKVRQAPMRLPTSVEMEEAGADRSEDPTANVEDPLATLERGYKIALVQAVAVSAFVARWLLFSDKYPNAWVHYFGCSLVGIVTSYLFVLFTKYYTDYNYAPVQRIASASRTGHGTNVIAGLAVGMESTALPAVSCGIALVASYWLGQTSGLLDTNGNPTGGLFGTAVATMGMLATAVYVLAMDTFGPITDNAGGIVEMSGQAEAARTITDRLDAVGNVTKATTKGYSIGAAALASFLLLRAFLDIAEDYTRKPMHSVDLAIPEVFVAALMGGTLIFLFSGWAMSAVGKAAGEVVVEVRRQFQEHPGIMDYTEKPDYAQCVAIVTKAALREMVRPGLLAVGTPIVVGVTFRIVGSYTSQPLLGAQCVAGLLMFSTATGILMALFLNNSGGAFDNAKKYIETGAHGGKKSFAHQAAVTGDTLGDPCKDTAGPSIHVLIKLLSTIALVACPLFVAPAAAETR